MLVAVEKIFETVDVRIHTVLQIDTTFTADVPANNGTVLFVRLFKLNNDTTVSLVTTSRPSGAGSSLTVQLGNALDEDKLDGVPTTLAPESA